MNLAARIAVAAVALSAEATLSACSGPPAHTHTHGHAHTAALPPGCRSALLVTAAVRSHLATDPSDVHGGLRQLDSLRDSLQPGALQLDVSLAAVALAHFQLDADMGQPVAEDARVFAQDLGKVTRYCRGG